MNDRQLAELFKLLREILRELELIRAALPRE